MRQCVHGASSPVAIGNRRDGTARTCSVSSCAVGATNEAGAVNAESSLRSLPAAISRTARARTCVVERRDLGARSRRAISARDLGGISARLGELAVEIGHLAHDAHRQRRRLGIVGCLRPDDSA